MALSCERLEEELCRLRLSQVVRTSSEELGRGSYATVFQVEANGTLCAAKEMHKILGSDKYKHDFLAECVRSSQLLHPNLVQFIGIHYPTPSAGLPWLVMELMYVSLSALVEKYEEKDIPINFKLSILVDVCQGLQFLHSRSIAHRDLSSNNVLLTRHLVAKIADLGMAKLIAEDFQKHTIAPGTQMFMPPEALSDDSVYGFPIDVFSLGCVTIHLISMRWPCPIATKVQDKETGSMKLLTEQQRREKYFVMFEQLPALKRLVEKCLQDIPNDRPVVGEVVKELKAIMCNTSPPENVNIIELYNSVVSYKEQLHTKEQELVERNTCLQSKEEEILQYSHELHVLKSDLIQVRQQLAEANSQLAIKYTQLAEKEQRLQAQLEKETKWNDNSPSTLDNQPKFDQTTEEKGVEIMPTMWLRNFAELEEGSYQVVTRQEIKDPFGISTGPNSEVALLDYSNLLVVMFEKKRKELALTKIFALKDEGKISKPHDIAVGDNIIAVSDWSNHVVKLFQLDGLYQHTIGSSKGEKDGQFNCPFGLAFNSKKILYVIDCSNYRVQAFDTANDNIFCGSFGSKGSGPGQFSYAAYIAVDSRDLVYVTDYKSDCINIFAAYGDHGFLGKININAPWPIAFTPDDYMLVADYKNDQLCVFSPPQCSTYNRFLMNTLGRKGKSKGHFNYICGIAVDKEGVIYIAEYRNKRFQYIILHDN